MDNCLSSKIRYFKNESFNFIRPLLLLLIAIVESEEKKTRPLASR